jgi:hypothetical protein
VVLTCESAAAYSLDLRQSAVVTRYDDLGRRLDAAIPAGAVLVGPERFWWPLRVHHYLALGNLAAQWEVAAQGGRAVPAFQELIGRSQADYLILNLTVPTDPIPSPAALKEQFWAFVNECSTVVDDWTDDNYGRVQIYRIRKTPTRVLHCGP